MKWFASLLAMLCSVTAFAGSSPNKAHRVWISDVTIISPQNLENVSVGSVLIDDGRIVRVEYGRHAPVPADAEVISAKGQFLIPGLIDSHVHLAGVPGVDMNSDHKPRPDAIQQYFEQLPRSYLYFGYTTLIDLAVMDQSVLNKFRQARLHPDLYDCGPSLPVANGYPMSFFPVDKRFQLFPNWLLDPQQVLKLSADAESAKHTPASAVAAVKASGGICVKTYFERGVGGDRSLPLITADLIAEVRRASHEQGLVLMIHANSFEAQQFAVNAGVDVIAHGMWNWDNLNARSELSPEIKLVLDRIVENRIGYQPTMQVMRGFRAYFDPGYLQLSAVAEVTPPALLAWFKSPEGKWFKRELAADNQQTDAIVRDGFDRGPIRRENQVIAYLAAKDARFLFGTDTPAAPTYGNLPGLNQYLEMRDLQQAGMSLRQILRAATLENARMFHLDSQLGTIEPGKIANLLLLKKSPLETIDAYDSIVTVWVHGNMISRDTLRADRRK